MTAPPAAAAEGEGGPLHTFRRAVAWYTDQWEEGDPLLWAPVLGVAVGVPWWAIRRASLVRKTGVVRKRLVDRGVRELPAGEFRSGLDSRCMRPLGSGHHSPVYQCWVRARNRPPPHPANSCPAEGAAEGDGEDYKVTVKATGWRSHDMLEDFEREVTTLLASQGHPTVVRLVGTHWDSPDMGYVLVYQYAEGDTLKSLTRHQNTVCTDAPPPAAPLDVARPRLGLASQFAVLRQIVDVMAYLHSIGIMYRDLKSLNLIVQHPDEPAKLRVWLIDFGSATEFTTQHGGDSVNRNLPPPKRHKGTLHSISSLLGGREAAQRANKRAAAAADSGDGEALGRTAEVGTYDWMAPEVWTDAYTEKCDVYSFAMALCEMVAWKDRGRRRRLCPSCSRGTCGRTCRRRWRSPSLNSSTGAGRPTRPSALPSRSRAGRGGAHVLGQ
eukprot:TRINITY_DN17712_c0_g1_i1.p1 TRINITY_DN17712_c0_g1~~TRINITY_DN17712_c0_g1_i1.p1  ORF type:complete len:439 (+),score=82.15 TRINITY_DN17712_c0_g1_i1:99-1415(+)